MSLKSINFNSLNGHCACWFGGCLESCLHWTGLILSPFLVPMDITQGSVLHFHPLSHPHHEFNRKKIHDLSEMMKEIAPENVLLVPPERSVYDDRTINTILL